MPLSGVVFAALSILVACYTNNKAVYGNYQWVSALLSLHAVSVTDIQ